MGEPIALAFEEREFGHSRLDEPADGLAVVLADRGVRAGQRVALMSSNRPEFVVTVPAVWRLGAAVVLIRPAWKHDEIRHALSISGAEHAVCDHPVPAEPTPMLSLDDEIPPTDRTFGTPGQNADFATIAEYQSFQTDDVHATITRPTAKKD